MDFEYIKSVKSFHGPAEKVKNHFWIFCTKHFAHEQSMKRFHSFSRFPQVFSATNHRCILETAVPIIHNAVKRQIGFFDYQKLSVMRDFTSFKEIHVLKTLSAVRISVSSSIVGVIIAVSTISGALVLPAPDSHFRPGGSLHANGVRLQHLASTHMPNKIVVDRTPCVNGCLHFGEDYVFSDLRP